MQSVVSEKGQVTIPKALRERLGIRPGQVLEFADEGGRLIASKATASGTVHAVYGILDAGDSTDEFLTKVRGEPDATDQGVKLVDPSSADSSRGLAPPDPR